MRRLIANLPSGLPEGQHNKVTISAHCPTPVPVLVSPWVLLGRKTANKQTCQSSAKTTHKKDHEVL